MRLRQVVLVARTLEPVVGKLRRLFELGEGFRDPGVGAFGLENTVFVVGDTFLEVVAPREDETAAGRYLDRRGAGGYMVIVQVDELESVRARIEELGVRVVWETEHSDIAAMHLHPADVGGAILSLDQPEPPESWRWGGPRWAEESDTSVVAEIVGVELQADDPEQLAQRWGEILEREPLMVEGAMVIAMDRGILRFVPSRDNRGDGVSGFDVAVTDRERLLANAAELDFELNDDVLLAAGVRISLVGAS